MANANETLGPGDRMILERLKDVKRPVYLLLNKVDLLKNKSDIDRAILSYMNEMKFEEIFPISAKQGLILMNF